MTKEIVYRVLYHQQNIPFELYARSVSESEMFGFVELEELVFDAVAADSPEEKFKQEFEAVKRTYIPLNNIFRIDAIEREDDASWHGRRSSVGNVTAFPTANVSKSQSGLKPNPSKE